MEFEAQYYDASLNAWLLIDEFKDYESAMKACLSAIRNNMRTRIVLVINET